MTEFVSVGGGGMCVHRHSVIRAVGGKGGGGFLYSKTCLQGTL